MSMFTGEPADDPPPASELCAAVAVGQMDLIAVRVFARRLAAASRLALLVVYPRPCG